MNLIKAFSAIAIVMAIASCGGGGDSASVNSNPGSTPPVTTPDQLTLSSDNDSVVTAYAYVVPELVLGIGRSSLEVTQGLNDIAQATLQENCDVSGEVSATLGDSNNNNVFDSGEVLDIEYSNCRYLDDPTTLDGSISISAIDIQEDSQHLLMSLDVLVAGEESAGLNGQVELAHRIAGDVETTTISGDQSRVTISVAGINEQVSRIALTSVIEQSTDEYQIDYNFAMNSEALEGTFTCSTSTSMAGTTFAFPHEYQIDCMGTNTMSLIKSDNEMALKTYNGGNGILGNYETFDSDGTLYTPVSSINPKLVESIEKNYTDLRLYRPTFVLTNESKDLLLVVNNDILYKFNLSDLALVSQITLDKAPTTFTLSDDGSRIFVSYPADVFPYNSSIIDIYDSVTLTKRQSVDLLDRFDTTAELIIDGEKSLFPIGSGDKWLVQYVYHERYTTNKYVVIAYYDNETFLTSTTRDESISARYGGLNLYDDKLYATDIEIFDRLVTFHEFELTETAITEQRVVTSDLNDVEVFNSHEIAIGDVIIGNGRIYSQYGWVFDLDSLNVVDSYRTYDAGFSLNTNRVYDLGRFEANKVPTYSLSTGYKLNEVNGYRYSNIYAIEKIALSENSIIFIEENTIKRVGKYLF